MPAHGGQQLCSMAPRDADSSPVLPAGHCNGSGFRIPRDFFFPLHKKKQIIIETSDFMFKDSEGETSKARPGNKF